MKKNEKSILSAKLDFLLDYAKKQYKIPRGLHLNSNDWKAFVHVKTGEYYSFIINGILKFTTYSDISKMKYEQIIKLVDFKNIENALLVLLLIETPNDKIIEFINIFLTTGEAKLYCQDKSFLYWGAKYNLTQIGSLYGPGENRPPDIRDPNRNFLVCKHLWLVLINFEKFINEFSGGLVPYYKRMFGLTTPEGLKRTQETIGEKGIRRIIAQAIIDINNTKSDKVKNLYIQLTLNNLNNILKPNSPKFYDTTVKKRTLEKETPETKKSMTEKLREKNKNRLLKLQNLIKKIKNKITEHL